LPFSCAVTFSVVSGAIQLVPYDPAWAQQFANEEALLEQVLAPWLVGKVEHVGSTSVPGLPAKPILDMIAPIGELTTAAAAREPLLEVGYASGVHRPAEAHYFFKPPVEHWWQRTHQLHLTEPTTPLWRSRVGFRNALRARPDLRDRYVELRRTLANSLIDDIDAYAGAKRDFVAEVLAMPEAQLPAG
jgi:GrpB-like predicted nucleotidyltransferase (UPF0157 family)